MSLSLLSIADVSLAMRLGQPASRIALQMIDELEPTEVP
jgi:high-affinity K+ transport system ATPase subunit B